jgi:hypothetical protein
MNDLVSSTAQRYAAKVISNRIDNQLRLDRSEEKGTIKVLLLGGAESGKTTIFKQMK